MSIRPLLDRLGLDARPSPDATTLRRLHTAWRTRVPYENVDIQLGRPILLEREALLDKFGRRRRGGFCYEMNTALAEVLRWAGFAVDVVEGGVRADRDDRAWGNHIALLVRVEDGTWLADAGIGDAFVAPLPLREGVHRQGWRRYRLERLDTTTWRMHHDPRGTVASYDFRTPPRDPAEFADRCRELATAPDSPFVRVLVAQRHRDGREHALRSRLVTTTGPDGAHERTLGGPDEFADALAATFGVPLADLGPGGTAALWAKAGDQLAAWRALQARAH
jgi:N-hydroxyarylamine O-acetyltransferase